MVDVKGARTLDLLHENSNITCKLSIILLLAFITHQLASISETSLIIFLLSFTGMTTIVYYTNPLIDKVISAQILSYFVNPIHKICLIRVAEITLIYLNKSSLFFLFAELIISYSLIIRGTYNKSYSNGFLLINLCTKLILYSLYNSPFEERLNYCFHYLVLLLLSNCPLNLNTDKAEDFSIVQLLCGGLNIGFFKFDGDLKLFEHNSVIDDINYLWFAEENSSTNKEAILELLASNIISDSNTLQASVYYSEGKVDLKGLILAASLSSNKIDYLFTSKLSKDAETRWYKLFSLCISSSTFLFIVDCSLEYKVREERERLQNRSLYLSKLLHDFKNPLDSLITVCKNIKVDKTEPVSSSDDEDERKVNFVKEREIERKYGNDNNSDNFTFISTIAGYLMILIEDLNTFTKIQLNRVTAKFELSDLVEVNIFPLIEFCANIFRIRQKNDSNKANINITTSFNLDSNIKIISNEQKLKQIIINLMSNSYKFTTSGYIKLSVNIIKDCNTDERKARVTIADSGLGMSKEEQAMLFTPFTVMDRMKELNIGGSGLGLLIVMELLSQINSSLQYSSSKNCGSTFWFDLPIINMNANYSSLLYESSSSSFQRKNNRENSINLNSESNDTNTLIDLNMIYSESMKNLIYCLNRGEKDDLIEQSEDSYNIIIENDEDNSPMNFKNYETNFNRIMPTEDTRKSVKEGMKKVNKIAKKFSSKPISRSLQSVNRKAKPRRSLISVGNNISISNCNTNSNRESSSNFYENKLGTSFEINSYNNNNSSNLNLNSIRSLNLYKDTCNNNFGTSSIINLSFTSSARYRSKSNSSNFKITPPDCSNALNILICDDETGTRLTSENLINKVAKELNIPVNLTKVENGIECLYHVYRAFINGIFIDMALVDENMPFMNGSNVIKILRTMAKERQINDLVLLSVTAYSDRASVDYLTSSGCNEVVNKPLNKQRVSELLRKYLIGC